MSDPEHARLLLNMAMKDFSALEGMLENAIFADEIFGFHAQQAVEKACKAWLAFLGIAYPRTHDLEVLFALFAKHGKIDLEPLYSLIDLSDFAVQFRYEAYEGLDEELDRPQVIGQINDLIARVQQLLVEE